MSTSALKRILQKDIKSIISNNLNSLGIYIEFNEEDFFKAKAMIVGPKDSLYEGGFLLFNIQFPSNYPFSPPDVSYISRNNVRIHPNLYVGRHSSGFGKVCLSILGTWSGPKWTTIIDISTVLLSIQSLLDGNPLHHEPGQEKASGNVNDHYNEIIQYETISSLIIKNINIIPTGFEIFHPYMIQELNKRHPDLLRKIEDWKHKEDCQISVPFYRISKELHYKKTYQLFSQLSFLVQDK